MSINATPQIDLTTVATVDIESDALLADSLDYTSYPFKLKKSSRLWVVVVRNVGTGEVFKATNEQITSEWMSDTLTRFKTIVLHNGIKFDLVVLKLFGVLDYHVAYPDEKSSTVFGRDINIIDTLVWSRLFNPDRFGGHGLAAWGDRLRFPKIDWRAEAIDLGLIEKNSPKGSEFKQFHPKMVEYCIRDTEVTAELFKELLKEYLGYGKWLKSSRLEHKLADLAVRRESFGFWFDRDLAESNLDFLGKTMQDLASRVNPLLPERPLTKGELSEVTPPKRQIKANGEPTADLLRFVDKTGTSLEKIGEDWYLSGLKTPHQEPLYKTLPATIEDGEAVKHYLLELGWEPSEWRERDLSKDAKKQALTEEKQLVATARYVQETLEGKYKKHRLDILEVTEDTILQVLVRKLKSGRPVRVPTSPAIRVGVEKDLCPSLVALGEKVAFAKDFADFMTYRHRRSSIAGGNEDEEGLFETGYLSQVRQEDGRIPTPAIEIGASSRRYRHIGVANIPRSSSMFGEEMRAMFGCGEGYLQFGYDFSSLEARIEGHYVHPYDGGPELAEDLIAEKPNDLHTKTAEKLGITRTNAKSVNYACLPLDTKILTDTGWKYYNELTEGDTVMSYNQDKDCIEPDQILHKHFFTDKEIFEFSNNNTKFYCTLDHRWYGWRRSKTRNKPSTKVFGYFQAKDFTQEHNIITTAPYCGGSRDITEVDATLMGWIASDGHIRWSKKTERTSASKGLRKGVVVSIAQSVKKFSDKILRFLESNQIDFVQDVMQPNSDNPTHIYRFKSEWSRDFLDRVIGERAYLQEIDWESWVLSLNRGCLEAFYKAFYEGDGSLGHRETIGQNVGKLFDGVRLAAFLLGRGRVNVGAVVGKHGSITILKRRHVTLQEISRKNMGVQDTFCLTTNNSSFIIQQDGFMSITGNCVYGAQPPKLIKMLGTDLEGAERVWNGFWSAVQPLKDLKGALERYWVSTGKAYILGIDGCKLITRSQHSLLNALFQSAGVIAAKYVTVKLMQKLEKMGLCTDPFIGKPDVCSMIEYHDEAQLAISPHLVDFKVFDTEEEANEFVGAWEGPQLSAVAKGTKWYVVLPNVVSVGIETAIAETEKELDLNVNLGFEYIVHRNWAGCH